MARPGRGGSATTTAPLARTATPCGAPNSRAARNRLLRAARERQPEQRATAAVEHEQIADREGHLVLLPNVALAQPASAGKSILPSPSLSRPSPHAGFSSGSAALWQAGYASG